MSINITIPGGEKRRLLTGGKYCPENIDVTAEGTQLPTLENPAAEDEVFLDKQVIDQSGTVKTGTFTLSSELSTQDSLISQIKTALQGKAAGIVPSGAVEIAENGTYDVTQYASAVVNVEATASTEAEVCEVVGTPYDLSNLLRAIYVGLDDNGQIKVYDISPVPEKLERVLCGSVIAFKYDVSYTPTQTEGNTEFIAFYSGGASYKLTAPNGGTASIEIRYNDF